MGMEVAHTQKGNPDTGKSRYRQKSISAKVDIGKSRYALAMWYEPTSIQIHLADMCHPESAANNTNNAHKRPRDLDDPNRAALRPQTRHKAGQRSTQQQRAVVLDLHDTTGSWDMASLVYREYKRLTGHPPPVEMFVEYYLEEGGTRPYLKELLQKLQEWKQTARINEVSICTSASNVNGWVTFIKQCMELYADTHGLFRRVIAREQCPRTMTHTGYVQTLKDLSIFSTDPDYVVIISTTPEYVINGRAIGVSPYRQRTGDLLKDYMKYLFPGHGEIIEQLFKAGMDVHHPDPTDFSGSDALQYAIPLLETIFPVA
jgi:hypothetical protein